MTHGGLPFPGIGCCVPDVYIHYVPDMINIWDIISTFTIALDVSAHGHPFLNNGFDNTQRASFISDLHTKFRIIIRQ